MNIITKVFEEDTDNIHNILLSDGKWYHVDSLDIKGHFGNKPQYFSLTTQIDEEDKEHGTITRNIRICGKVSDIKLIDVEYS